MEEVQKSTGRYWGIGIVVGILAVIAIVYIRILGMNAEEQEELLYLLQDFFFFIGIITNNSHNVIAEDVLLSKEDFFKIAFGEDVPRRKGLRFKGEVKEIAQGIMGSNYKKLRMKYWRQDQKTACILERIGKVEVITAGFIVENCRISSIHVLVYRETHGWEVKYPSFRDQFVGINMVEGFKLDKVTSKI